MSNEKTWRALMRVLARVVLVGRALLIVFAFVVLCSAQDKELRELADSLTSQIKSRGKGPVAITSFVNTSYCPAFSIFLVDRLSILMARGKPDFDVVTRDRVEEVFKEINLALGKNYDASTFAKIGKQLGTRSLIRGSYTVQSAGASVSLAAQILDVETGRIIGGEFAEIRYTGDIKAMLDPQTCTTVSNSPRIQPPAGAFTSGMQNQAAKSQTIHSAEVEDIQFSVTSCKASGSTIMCGLILISRGQDRELFICRNGPIACGKPARIVDEAGREYIAESVRIGNRQDRATLVGQIPTTVEINFRQVSPMASRIALLDLDCVADGRRFSVKLRQLPVSR